MKKAEGGVARERVSEEGEDVGKCRERREQRRDRTIC
jgi:hypothetical protein